MRRILLVLTAAMVMALMMVAMALPAFAKINCTPNGTGDVCSPASGCGGEGGQAYGGSGGGGGGGAHTTNDSNVGAGGSGFGGQELGPESGGSGGRCEATGVAPTGETTYECVGSINN